MLNDPLPRTTKYQAAFNRYTNYNHTAALIQIILPLGQSCGGSNLLREIRQIAQSKFESIISKQNSTKT